MDWITRQSQDEECENLIHFLYLFQVFNKRIKGFTAVWVKSKARMSQNCHGGSTHWCCALRGYRLTHSFPQTWSIAAQNNNLKSTIYHELPISNDRQWPTCLKTMELRTNLSVCGSRANPSRGQSRETEGNGWSVGAGDKTANIIWYHEIRPNGRGTEKGK